MGTTILIPTDFKEQSIERLRALLLLQKEESLQVILIHGIYLSNSISELLFFDQNDLKIEVAGKKFLRQLIELEQELGSKVESIQLLLFSGLTQSSFNQFAEVNHVDRIILPGDNELDWSHKKSKNILPFLKNSKISKQLAIWEKKPFSNSSFQIKLA